MFKSFVSALTLLCLLPVLAAQDGEAGTQTSSSAASDVSVSPGAELAPLVPSLWQFRLADFSEEGYLRAVQAAFSRWEKLTDASLKPGKHGRVALKLYTASGPGLATPRALTRAVVEVLVSRGYTRENIVLYDQHDYSLREAGYLPPRSEGGESYAGASVTWLREDAHYNDLWFYDSPLPARTRSLAVNSFELPDEAFAEDRKSYLPVPLIADMDFWINLPMVTDVPGLGVSGALANATLWNASNTKRFLNNPASAPVAVAEIAAIPELREPWVFTLMTLERYQFIGGPHFNSLYTAEEPMLLMSDNPVALDYLMLEKMNRQRAHLSLPLIEPRPLLFEYAEAIGLGSWKDVPLVAE